MNQRIVVVGSLNVDRTVRVERHPAPGETLPGTGGAVTPGGKGANQAVAAALLGGDVTMIGAVGDDPDAAVATAGLRAAGVDITRVRAVPGPTGTALIVVDRAGENTIIVVAGANGAVNADAVAREQDVVAGAAAVLLQGEIPRDGLEAAARAVRGRLVLNLAPAVAVDPAVLRRADPLVVNEHEAAAALAILTGQDRGRAGDGPAPGESAAGDPATLAAALRAAGVPSIVITLGARGALVAKDTETTMVPSPPVQPVDTTGAGDAFAGALALRLAAGEELVGAARFACRVGAFSCTGHGAQPSYPRSEDTLPGDTGPGNTLPGDAESADILPG